MYSTNITGRSYFWPQGRSRSWPRIGSTRFCIALIPRTCLRIYIYCARRVVQRCSLTALSSYESMRWVIMKGTPPTATLPPTSEKTGAGECRFWKLQPVLP